MNDLSLFLELNYAFSSRAIARVLSPQTWPFSLDWLPSATYLVGGNVRDALLERHAGYLDLDFVLAEKAVETAKAIARHHKAGFVLLDAERQIARVVFENATVDFAQQVGATLEDDLRRRDFTVNAIAYCPHTDQILDPLQGYLDLRQRLIRMIAPENLKEDPLRLLRAYRQAAQLQFTLEPETRTVICQLTELLQTIAAERVQAELNYLLGHARGTAFLSMAWEDGLLSYWLPYTTETGLKRIACIDTAAVAIAERWPVLGEELGGWMREQHNMSGSLRSWIKVAKLACLTAPEPAMAEHELWRLKYSRSEIQAVHTVLQFLPQLQDLTDLLSSRRAQYYFFKGVGSAFPALVVLALSSGISIEAIAPLVDRFINSADPVAHPSPLLTGKQLMAALNLRPGPKVGQLLEAIQLAQAEGTVTCQSDALDFAKTLAGER